jgi:hypothetical protein
VLKVVRDRSGGGHDGHLIEHLVFASGLGAAPLSEATLLVELDGAAASGGFQEVGAGGFDAALDAGELEDEALGAELCVDGGAGFESRGAGVHGSGERIAPRLLAAGDLGVDGAEACFDVAALGFDLREDELLVALLSLTQGEQGFELVDESGHGEESRLLLGGGGGG